MLLSEWDAEPRYAVQSLVFKACEGRFITWHEGLVCGLLESGANYTQGVQRAVVLEVSTDIFRESRSYIVPCSADISTYLGSDLLYAFCRILEYNEEKREFSW